MKRKGFTLIELLAVIVILAVISLIATPMILGVIEDTKLKSAEQSVNGYLDAVEKQIITSELTEENQIKDGLYTLPISNVEVKGSKPTSGWIVIQDGEVTNYSMVMNEYVVTKNSETVKGTKISGPSKEEASETDTHRGIVYLDPTNLSNVCNAENSVSTTETKTGCMKWYIFNDDEDNYTMILDHNTTSRIKWNDDNKNESYEESNLYAVVQDLKITSGWIVEPRIISAEEINTITGKEEWTNTDDWYCLDSKEPDNTNYCAKAKSSSSYKWLFNNLYDCENYGCSINDNSSYIGYGIVGEGQTWGYWTSTTYGTDGSDIWRVDTSGALINGKANYAHRGIRPVITISKSIIE